MAINYHNHNINTSGTITSPSGNFTTLIVNGTSVSNFNSSVSGLVSGIYAPLSGKLNQFANTSSSELSSIITDETGTGLLVFNSSPTLTGIPLVPTATSGTNTNQIASTAFVRTEVSNLVASAPSTLDTLNELASALGNDSNFSTTITNNLAGKANLSGASFTGSISAPTGNFNSLLFNGSGVSITGHSHTSSDITNFNSSVSGLIPVKNVTGSGYVSVSSSSGIYNINVTGLQPSGNYSVIGHTHSLYDGTLPDITNLIEDMEFVVYYPEGLSQTNVLGHLTYLGSRSLGNISVSGTIGSTSGLLLVTTSGGTITTNSGITSSYITNFNSSVSGLLPVTNVTAGSGISVSASSGNYTINIDVIDCGQVLAPPNAPTNLSIIASNASLALSWTAPTYAGSTAITGHIVEYTPSGGSASTVNTNSTSTSYTLSGLTNGTSYSIRVRAINSIGNGSYSNAVSGTPAQANLLSLNSYYWRHYNNSPSTDPMGTSFSGAGTSGNSAIAIIGTNYNTIGTNYYGDARMWISVVTGGTLSYTLTYKNTGGYNGGALLYKTSTSPSQHNQSLQDAITNFTIINSASNSDSAGTITTKTGTVSVNTGDYIVLRWYQDDGGTLIPESKVVMSITP